MVHLNGRKYRRLVCYVPDSTDHKSACTYNFAEYDKRLYPNPLHPLVDYMIQPQQHIKRCTNIPSRQYVAHLRCCVFRTHPAILLSLYNVRNKQITQGGLLHLRYLHAWRFMDPSQQRTCLCCHELPNINFHQS